MSRNASSGLLIYYFTYNFILKLNGRLVNDLAQTVFTSIYYAVPDRFHHREILLEPFTISLDPDDDKLGLSAFVPCRSVLYKITFFEVRNLQLELNLWKIMFRHLGLNLTSQRTLDLDKKTIFCDAVR